MMQRITLAEKCNRNLNFSTPDLSAQSTFRHVHDRAVINAGADTRLALSESRIHCNRATALKSRAKNKQRAIIFFAINRSAALDW